MDIMYEYQKNNNRVQGQIFGQVMKDQDKWDGINWINEFKQINKHVPRPPGNHLLHTYTDIGTGAYNVLTWTMSEMNTFWYTHL